MGTPVIISIAAIALGIVALLWRMHTSTIKRIDRVYYLLKDKYDHLSEKIDAQCLEMNREIDAIYRLLDSLKDLIAAVNGRLSRIEGMLSNRPWEVNSLGGSASFPVMHGQRSMDTSRP